MTTRTISHEEEMTTIAEEVLSMLPQKDEAHVLALTGELGAGKTAFVQALAKLLGIVEHVTSPTFLIMRSYEVPGHEWVQTLTHIDAYRVEDIDEMRVIRFPELLVSKGRIVCVEWPENIKALIPEDAFRITIEIEDGETRIVTYGTNGN